MIGDVGDTLAEARTRWRRLNEVDPFPDTVCLDDVAGSGRVDALRERTWIRRYLITVNVVRAVRRAGRTPARVSGFGPRITPGLPPPVLPDDPGAPLLLQIGHEFKAYDPVGIGLVDLSRQTAAMLEAVLGSAPIYEVRSRCAAVFPISSARADEVMYELLQRSSQANVAASWCAERQIRLPAGR